MVKQVIIDTDTISFFFRKNASIITHFKDYFTHFDYINISVITYYEILNGLYYKDAKRQLEQFNEFIALNNIVVLDDEVAQKAASVYANLRKKGITIGHNDVLIAATAMVNDMVLVTNNVKHFQVIEGLEFVNWMEE